MENNWHYLDPDNNKKDPKEGGFCCRCKKKIKNPDAAVKVEQHEVHPWVRKSDTGTSWVGIDCWVYILKTYGNDGTNVNRIFLELDESVDELHSSVPRPISIIPDCGKDVLKTWTQVAQADEIYFSSKLLTNGSSTVSSSELFNMLMEKANKTHTNGKHVYCCVQKSELLLNRLDPELFKKCFEDENSFFALDGEKFVKITSL